MKENVAQQLVKYLEARGVEHIFGLCGHTNIAVLAALEKSSIRFVNVRHEQIAAHAADGYSDATVSPAMTNAPPSSTRHNPAVLTVFILRPPCPALDRRAHQRPRHRQTESTRTNAPSRSPVFRDQTALWREPTNPARFFSESPRTRGESSVTNAAVREGLRRGNKQTIRCPQRTASFMGRTTSAPPSRT